MSNLRVVYVDHCAQLSGGELALLHLLPALVGIEPIVILGEDGPLRARLDDADIAVEVLELDERVHATRRDQVGRASSVSRVARTGRDVHRLAKRIRQLDADIVHTNSLKAAVYGGLAGRAARVPVVWHIRDRMADDYLPRRAVRMVRTLGRVVPRFVIANSQATLDTLESGHVVGDPIPRSVIASPVPLAWDVVRPTGQHPFTVAMVGRLAPWKGQHVLLEAFAAAFPDGDERMVVAGSAMFGEEPYAAELLDLASRLGIADRVEFAGFVDDVRGLLGRVDALVHASVIPEPFGQVVAEGLAAGLPVIAADAGGPAEMIDHDVNGLLYPPGDPEALAVALRRVAGDATLRNRLGDAAPAVVEPFRPEHVARIVEDVYRRVLQR